MELTADLLLEAKFSPARRGYDMNEVDDFLERCAEGLDVLLARLRAEFERAERAEDALRAAQAELEARPTIEVERPTAEPVAPVEPVEPVEPTVELAPEGAAAPVPAPAPTPIEVNAEEPMRILIAAERTASETVAEARNEAERIRSEAETIAAEARREAESLLASSRAEAEAEARRAGQVARREIEVEVVGLREDRDALDNDVRALQRWLDDQRARLRTTARDLQRIVEDPAALRELPRPQLRELNSTAVEVSDEADPSVGDDAGADQGTPEDATAGPLFDQDSAEALPDVSAVFGDVADHDDELPAAAGNVFGDEPTQAVPTVDSDGDDPTR